jgi:folylpolyglutamate synthase/dihydropteroate synthase
VHERPEFSVIRQRLALPLEEYGGPEAPQPSHVLQSPLPLPARAPPVTIAASPAEALRMLESEADAGTRQMHVLVTGSLYLVGSALEAMAWEEAR